MHPRPKVLEIVKCRYCQKVEIKFRWVKRHQCKHTSMEAKGVDYLSKRWVDGSLFEMRHIIYPKRETKIRMSELMDTVMNNLFSILNKNGIKFVPADHPSNEMVFSHMDKKFLLRVTPIEEE